MQLAHTPLGARGAAAAVLARGRVEDARSDHGAQSRLPQRLAPEAPSSVVWACEAAVAPNVCDAGHRARRGHRAREWKAIPAVKEGGVPTFSRPRRREACRADAHGNRPPSQLVVNPARRVSGQRRPERAMSWALPTELVSKGSRPSGSTRALGNQPAREGLAEITSSILRLPFPVTYE